MGVLAGVSLPGDRGPVPAEVWARLHSAEQVAAAELRGFRQVEWVGARLAFHAAAAALGAGDGPLLSGPSRAPAAPSGLAVSLTHKRDLAVALVGLAEAGALGIDLEGDGRPHETIAGKVLVASELAAVARAPEGRRWLEVMVRFAVKEAVYKAVQARLGRYVGFDEATVEVALDAVATSTEVPDFARVEALTRAGVTMTLARGEVAPRLEAWCEHAGGRVLAAVRAGG